ncbi:MULTISPECIES: hypothetical protein [Bacillus]|uniref:Uncharacterized protein n=4 Tax=Bacillus cereus group TaxID=86661 RepID=A0A1C4FCI0_BACMY|nr:MULTISPECIES: hypothetical protein [Bacillus]EEL69210.1 hypothetical protein bcere0026_38790 [Bacillus mycoides]EJQ83890.1 hypothetical protein IGC_01416 [Bacillus cereus HuA4-10]EOO17099.1 hypothetical protein IGA_03280 [Bacillus cereus HuA3-9]EOP66210.1 hypothetical protein IIQ_02996 [Bacillus cereus VD118]MBJ7982690.1 hypothetical protein [Bacillus cereus]
MYYYYVPQVYPYTNYYAVNDMRQQFGVYPQQQIQQMQQPQQQPVQEQKPYLMTWPYSNVYYGNYYES